MQAPEPMATDIQDFAPVIKTIQSRVDGFTGEVNIERIGGGQSNPTYFLTTQSMSLVLRKRPAGLTSGASHDVRREFDFLTALQKSGLPLPAVHFYSDDMSLVGTDFYVMERVESRQIFDSSLPELSKSDRTTLYEALARDLATLHRFDWEASPLKSYFRQGDFLGRQIHRWNKAFDNTSESELCRPVYEFLVNNKPANYTNTVVHGDFKFSNLLLHNSKPEIVAVIDWELATIGDPLTDLAHTWASLWAIKPEEYGGLFGIDCAAMGLPDGDAFIHHYLKFNPIAEELPLFYKVLAIFRYAGIFQGIAKRLNDGIAASSTAGEVGKLGRVFLERALELIERGK